MYKDQNQDIYLNKSLFVTSRQQNILNYYEVIPKQLGRGAYGVVYKAKQKNASNQMRAIKKMSRKLLKNPDILVNQVQVMKALDHPNIIRLYQVFQDASNVYLVQDLCTGGELFDRIDSVGNFSESTARDLFRQMIDAVNHCHTEKIAHRDLKPENFLFLSAGSNNMKLIDFGLCFRWKKDMCKQLQETKSTKMVGTSYYIAPEVIAGKYDQRCDIWSAGVILYILVTALPPFDGEDDKEIIECVKKLHYTFNIPEMKNISPQLKDLIAKILVPDFKRISIQQIYRHPWMNKNVSEEHLKINFAGMKEFGRSSKLKKLTAHYIASQLSELQIEKLGVLFRQIDTNHDGYLSIQQLKAALSMQHQNKSYKQLKELMDSIDTDHNGKINYTEFIASTLDKYYLGSESHLRSVFRMLDKDGNGTVERDQLQGVLEQNGISNFGGKDVDDIIRSCDTNGDGKIDFQQFVTAIRKENK